MKNIFLSAIAMAVIFTSCRFVEGQRIKGDGNVSTEKRSVTGFTGVETHGSIDIEISQGDYKVTVESDQNIIPYIVTEVVNGHLQVRFKDDFHGYNYSSAKVYVTAPALNAFEVHGSGNINGKGLISDNGSMEINVSGSGDVELDLHSPSVSTETYGSGNITLGGETKDFSTSVSGSGDVHAFDLKAETVKTSIHGSGNTEVSASVKLESGIFGSGDVNYKGSPQVNTETHGSGSLNHVN
ncbi:MAG: head GIN domain-containing protein [Bacteroidota bacterium]